MLQKIAVLADIHGNLSALKVALADARQQAITDYWFLGDLFLPGPGAEDLYQALAAVQPRVWLQGNWEQGIYALINGQTPLEDPSEVYFARLTQYLMTRLAPAHLQELATRPIATSLTVNGLDFGLSHNQPERSTGHDLYPTEAQAHFDHLGGQHDVAVYGHIHQQLLRTTNQGQLIINPGATGQPYSPYTKFLADQRAHYAILTVTDAGQLSVDFRKVSYDIAQEIERARQVKLPYLNLYRHLRQTGLTSTHDKRLLQRVNDAYGYAQEVKAYFHR